MPADPAMSSATKTLPTYRSCVPVARRPVTCQVSTISTSDGGTKAINNWRHGQHASVGKALADCLDLAERTQRAAGIAGEELLQRFSEQDETPLGAVRSALGQQAASVLPPATSLSELTGEDHAVPEPESKADRACHVVVVESFAVTAREELTTFVFVPDEVSRSGIALDVVKGERL